MNILDLIGRETELFKEDMFHYEKELKSNGSLRLDIKLYLLPQKKAAEFCFYLREEALIESTLKR